MKTITMSVPLMNNILLDGHTSEEIVNTPCENPFIWLAEDELEDRDEDEDDESDPFPYSEDDEMPEAYTDDEIEEEN